MEWSSLTINGIEVPAMDIAWRPDPQHATAPKMECWIFHQWKHIQRNCGPGGHRNSKTSRRLIRALQGAI